MSKKYEVVMRSNTTFKTSPETITVHEGQNVQEEAIRIATGYGATVDSIFDTEASVFLGTMKDPIFYAGKDYIVDTARWNGTEYVTNIYGNTLAELRDREENIYDGVDENGMSKFYKGKPYANARIMEWEDASPLIEAAQKAKYVGPVKQVSEERFNYMLEVLPPMGWHREPGSESFKMSEMLTHNITTIAVRKGVKYYEFNDVCNLPHATIMEKVEQAIKEGTVEDNTADKPLM